MEQVVVVGDGYGFVVLFPYVEKCGRKGNCDKLFGDTCSLGDLVLF